MREGKGKPASLGRGGTSSFDGYASFPVAIGDTQTEADIVSRPGFPSEPNVRAATLRVAPTWFEVHQPNHIGQRRAARGYFDRLKAKPITCLTGQAGPKFIFRYVGRLALRGGRACHRRTEQRVVRQASLAFPGQTSRMESRGGEASVLNMLRAIISTASRQPRPRRLGGAPGCCISGLRMEDSRTEEQHHTHLASCGTYAPQLGY